MPAWKLLLAAALALLIPRAAFAAGGSHSCVWKVTGPNGHTLYLGGSIHALRSTDYPLPAAYNRAFDACDRLAFEVDNEALRKAAARTEKSGRYPKGDSLRRHVDPRTYDYLRRVFARLHVPEEKYAIYRPWFLALLLQAPQLHGLSPDLGIEGFLERRARANRKPIAGLETPAEHMEIFSGLNDRQSEAVLLLTFIPQEENAGAVEQLTAAWRRGDPDPIARQMKNAYKDFPAFAERLLDARNRRWIPEIERYLQGGQTCFVVVGAAHLGGPNGVLALLRARGYQLEQM